MKLTNDYELYMIENKSIKEYYIYYKHDNVYMFYNNSLLNDISFNKSKIYLKTVEIIPTNRFFKAYYKICIIVIADNNDINVYNYKISTYVNYKIEANNLIINFGDKSIIIEENSKISEIKN